MEYQRYNSIKSIILLTIIILGFFYRLCMTHIAWIDPDEGSYLYDASLLLKGLIPYKDYFTRNPFYLAILAVIIKLFGYSLISVRLLSVIANTIAIYFIYKIGQHLYDANTGIMIAFVYSLSPYIAFWNSLVETQALQAVFTIAGIYFFLIAIKRDKRTTYFLSGLLFGIAFLIRESAIAFMLLELAILFYVRRPIRRLFWSCIGFSIPVSWYIYFIHQAGTAAFSYSVWHSFIWLISGFGLNYLLKEDVGILKNSIFFCKEALYLVIPVFIYFGILLKELSQQKYRVIINSLFYSFLLLGLSIFLYWLAVSSFDWLFIKNSYLSTIAKTLFLFIFFLLLLCSGILFHKSGYIIGRKYLPHIVSVFWITILLLGYFMRKRFYFSYFSELSPVLSIITGFVMVFSFRQRNMSRGIYITFIVSLIFVACSTQLFYLQAYKSDKFYSVRENQQIADFLKSHTLPDEKIFTANNVVLFCANRSSIYNISYPNIYAYGESISSPQRFNYPSVTEIMNYLESHRVRYCLIDRWTQKYYFVLHPSLKEYIYSNYNLIKKIGDAEIYIRKRYTPY